MFCITQVHSCLPTLLMFFNWFSSWSMGVSFVFSYLEIVHLRGNPSDIEGFLILEVFFRTECWPLFKQQLYSQWQQKSLTSPASFSCSPCDSWALWQGHLLCRIVLQGLHFSSVSFKVPRTVSTSNLMKKADSGPLHCTQIFSSNKCSCLSCVPTNLRKHIWYPQQA